jgi:hypothetical protein
MKLCRLLGSTLAELDERLSPDELPFWIAQYQLDPWGDERAEWSRAIVGTAIARSFGATKVEPKHLVPSFKRLDPEQEAALARAHWETGVAIHNARFKTGGK